MPIESNGKMKRINDHAEKSLFTWVTGAIYHALDVGRTWEHKWPPHT